MTIYFLNLSSYVSIKWEKNKLQYEYGPNFVIYNMVVGLWLIFIPSCILLNFLQKSVTLIIREKNFQWLFLKTNKQYSNNSFPRITLYLSSQYNIHIIYHNIYIFASKVKLHTYYPYLNFQIKDFKSKKKQNH